MPDFDRAVIVGMGLLGGSIGMAMRERRVASTVIGVGRRPETLDAALRRGAVDEATLELKHALPDADLVIVCTPVQNVARIVRQADSAINSSALITDVGSTKGNICRELEEPVPTFIGSHPLAGSHQSGVEFAQGDLLEGKTTIVTPSPTSSPLLVQDLEKFWQSLGSQTVQMTPQSHDQAVARTSHLPHVVAAALAACTEEHVLPLVAAGWCDTTRVAGGNVDLWSQILSENRGPTLTAMRHFASHFDQWLAALESEDTNQLESLLTLGKQKRDSLGN